MRIPFQNFSRQYAGASALLKCAMIETAQNGQFILRSEVAGLEADVCGFTGAREAIATSNATDGLKVALKGMGIGPGDQVITPGFGFISQASTICLAGGRPIFADVDPRTGLLDAAGLESRITQRTKAIVVVHLLSSLADMPRITAVARQHNLKVLEDAAVALGGSADGRFAGLMGGDAGVYSFWTAKPLAGIGDGGMIVTDDQELAAICRRLRNHGQDGKERFVHYDLGWNNRMDEINARFLRGQLQRFPQAQQRRRAIAARYLAAFEGAPDLVQPILGSHGHPVPYRYAVQCSERDRLKEWLASRGIEARPCYPVPLHLQPCFRHLGYRLGDLPNTEALSARALALPFYPELTDGEVDYVTDTVLEFFLQ